MRLNGEWSLLAGNRVYELTLNQAHANPPIIGNTVFVLHFYLRHQKINTCEIKMLEIIFQTNLLYFYFSKNVCNSGTM